MAKRRTASKSGGKYCITTTKQRSKNATTGRGGLAFSTVCYTSAQAQTDALLRRMTTGGPSSKGVFSVMAYKRKGR